MNALRMLLLLLLFLFTIRSAPAHPNDRDALKKAVQAVIDESGGRVGVAAMRFSGGDPDSVLFDGGGYFPMQSVYKLPLALAVLDKVDRNGLRLHQEISIRHAELDTATWSPMLKAFPEEDFRLSVLELIQYTVSQSDNNACDVLFRVLGGPRQVRRYLNRNGIRGIDVVSTEREMHTEPKLQYRNRATPAAMLGLLERINSHALLKPASSLVLDRAMTLSKKSAARIGGRLPDKKIRFMHKTGTSGTDAGGRTAAVNDAGILQYGGVSLGIVVFVSDFNGDVARGEAVISRISRLLWDYYMPQQGTN